MTKDKINMAIAEHLLTEMYESISHKSTITEFEEIWIDKVEALINGDEFCEFCGQVIDGHSACRCTNNN